MIRIIRENIKTVVVNLVVFLVLALMLEFALYLGLKNPSAIPSFLLGAYRFYYQTSDRQIIQVTDCAQYDPALFYILKPGSCTFRNREFNVAFDINSQGLRDDEESLNKPPIIVLGDSYAMGWGVQQQEAFAQVLEQLSGQRVLNAGMSSYGTAREIKLLQRLDTDHLKYVILQYHANDFEENLKAQKYNYHLPIKSQKSYDSLCGRIEQREKYYLFKNSYGISKAFATNYIRRADYSLPGADSDSGEAVEAKVFLDVLLHSEVPMDNVQLIVFKADHYDNLDEGFADDIDRLVQTPSYSSLNIKTLRFKSLLNKDDYFILDDHMNAKGHKKIATGLYEYINQLAL